MESEFGPLLTNDFGERYLRGINRSTFDTVGSEILFRRQLKDLLREDHFHIVIGTDSGLLLRYLRRTGLPRGARYLFIEHPEVIALIEEEITSQLLDDRIACTTSDRYQEQALAAAISSYIFLGQVLLHQSIAAQDDFLGIYQDIVFTLRKELKQFVWEVNHSLGSEVFIRRQFENLGENRRPAKPLLGLFQGKTAVLLAGGPSLDEIFPWLQENRERVVVLAVSRVCRRLQEVGVVPDFIFSIDPHPVSFDVSKEALHFWRDAVLVHMYHVTPLLLGQWCGRSFFLGPRTIWKSELNAGTVGAPGPTVTNTAIKAAIEMGFSQLILAGVDLCFSREGFTHASGSNERQAGPQLGRTGMQVETNGGWPAETDHDLFSAIHQLVQQAREAARRGCRIVNPAPGAVRIEGIRFCPAAELEIEPLAEPPGTILDHAVPEETAESRIAYYREVLDELADIGRRLRQIEKLALEGLKANAGLFGRDGKKADFRCKGKMDRIEKKLKKDAELSLLVKRIGIRHFLGLTRVDSEREWSDEEIERTGRHYYGAYRVSSASLLKMVEAAEQRLQVRLEEEKSSPDFSRLASQWRQDGQPGRVGLWSHRHPQADTGLAPEVRVEMAALQAEFQKVLERRETAHLQRSKAYAGLGGVLAKARNFFQRRNKEGLHALQKGLQAHPNPQAEHYRELVAGYLAELDGNSSEALAAYRKIVEASFAPLMEDVLRRVASVSLAKGDAADALLALNCLAAVSPGYLLQYADLLRLTGDHRRALDTYADYLDKVPQDLSAMMKLGLFYRELGIREGVELMFNQIITLDPTNQAAERLLQE